MATKAYVFSLVPDALDATHLGVIYQGYVFPDTDFTARSAIDGEVQIGFNDNLSSIQTKVAQDIASKFPDVTAGQVIFF